MTLSIETVVTCLGLFAGGVVVAVKVGPAKLKSIITEALAVHRAQEVADVTEAVRAEVKDLVRETVRAELSEPNARIAKLEGKVETLQALEAGRQRPDVRAVP